jgi:cytoskeletal protein CcmA (bactofilin family)
MQSDQATMVGESIVITGNLTGDEDLIILGRVEGQISLSRTLFVSTNGIAKADIAVENAVISGVVVGNVNASDSIQITETGRVVGDLNAPRIMITTGARVRGQVSAGEVSQVEASPAPSAAMGRNINQMYERMGLPARRPMAQPPVAPRAAAQPQMARSEAQAANPSAQAQNPAAPMSAQAPTSDAQNAARRAQPSAVTKKKAPQTARRRD